MEENNKRQAILKAALDLFAQKGYNSTSIDAIGDAVGIKGPNIYKYFKNKEDIFLSLKDSIEALYLAKMKENSKAKVSSGKDLKEFSINQPLFTMDNDLIKKMRRMGAVEQFRNEEHKTMSTQYQYVKIKTMFTEIFKNMIEDGIMVNEDPEILALAYMSPTSILIQVYDRDPKRREEVIKLSEAHFDLFIKTFCLK